MKLLSFCFACILAASPVCAQKDDPLAPIKAALKDPTKPFSLIVEFKLKPGSADAVKALVASGVKGTREEAGNLAYACHQDAQNPDTLVFVEIWSSLKALEFHVSEPYTQAMVGKLLELSAEPMKARVLSPLVPAASTRNRPIVRPTPR